MGKTVIEQKMSSKIGEIGQVTARTKLMAIAATLDDVILLGRGDPDLDTPKHIKEAGKKAIDNNQTHYTEIRGLLSLREAIAVKYKRDNNVEYDPKNEIMVTVGAQESLFLTMYALLDPGDEVLIGEPRYNAYDDAIEMVGGKVRVIPCKAEEDFLITPERLEAAISPKTKAVVIVNPGNPVGFYGPNEIRALAEVIKKHDLIVISDEIYEHIIFDGTPFLSFASIPGMKERTITLNGMSKAYAMTGWRCGYLCAPAPFCEKITEYAHTLCICAPTPTQFAALEAYTGPQDSVDEYREIYRSRLNFMKKILDDLGFKYIAPRAGFYLFTDVHSIGMDTYEFCESLLKEQKVLVFPGELYMDPTNHHIRISLQTPTDRLEEAGRRITAFVKSRRK